MYHHRCTCPASANDSSNACARSRDCAANHSSSRASSTTGQPRRSSAVRKSRPRETIGGKLTAHRLWRSQSVRAEWPCSVSKLGIGTAQHAIVAGKTGPGKSTLLHANHHQCGREVFARTFADGSARLQERCRVFKPIVRVNCHTPISSVSRASASLA